MLVPAFGLLGRCPSRLEVGGFRGLVIAALFASNVRQAFLKPLFLAMGMTKFRVVVRGQAIDMEWDGRLSSVSSKFRDLSDKALAPPPLPLPAGSARRDRRHTCRASEPFRHRRRRSWEGEQHERTSGGDVCGRDGCRVDCAGRGPGRGAEGGTGVRRGRRVWMDLSAGSYKIRQGSDDKIVVRWESTDPDAGQMKVTLDARGADASILTHAQSGEFRVTIDVPARTDLTVRLSAGNVSIEGVTGDKDINSWAGNVDVEVKDRNEYRSVEASVTAGDLNASAFDTKTGGLFRLFLVEGPRARTSWRSA